METSEQALSAPAKRTQRFWRFQFQPGDQELIEQLPEAQRQMLRSEGGYKQRSEEMGLPIGTVRSRLHRARAALEKLRQTRDGIPEEDAPLHS